MSSKSNALDSLGNRCKQYESVTSTHLVRRMPVIMRLDFCAFSKWTQGLQKPYDKRLVDSMAATMKYLVDNIQGAVFGYTQSDEISILIRDYDKLTTEAWFGNNIQKMTSVSASMCSAFFNEHIKSWSMTKRLAICDSRVFNVPKEDVTNVFLWRQQDSTRNSINLMGQKHIGHKKLQNLNTSQVQDALMALEIPINWNDCPTFFKRGIGYIKETNEIDWEIPIFSQNRNYINDLVYIGDN